MLTYGETGKVGSTLLDTVNRAGTANEILRDVLGLQHTLPLWAEGKIEQLVREFEEEDITTESLGRLREKMNSLGLGKYLPSAVARIVESKGEQ